MLAPPSGSNRLFVLVGAINIEGGFPNLAVPTESLTRALAGRRVSVADIYAFARSLEHAYAAAGYPLARVIVPAQKLSNGSALTIVVVDGYIENIDLAGVPAQVRHDVYGCVADLINKRHVTLDEIERALLVAGRIPGLTLRSALMPGVINGGVKLVLEGRYRAVTGSLGTDDALPQSLGTWQLRSAVAANDTLGLGEQIYAAVGGGVDVARLAHGNSPLSLYGGGVVIPLGHDGFTVNSEYTHSTTRTAGLPGVPASTGEFDRVALRLQDPIILTRTRSLRANLSLEQIFQKVSAPDFGETLSEDRYVVLRGTVDFDTSLPQGASLRLGVGLSRGLGGRTAEDAASTNILLSRQGAGPAFTKTNLSVRYAQPLLPGLRLDVTGLGQSSFHDPLLLAEQFSLDGPEAVSAFAAGTFNVDQGATLRVELVHPIELTARARPLLVSPYVFGAVGRGQLFKTTTVEQTVINAGSVGLGVRGTAQSPDGLAFNLGVEVARQFSNVASAEHGWRYNVVSSVAF